MLLGPMIPLLRDVWGPQTASSPFERADAGDQGGEVSTVHGLLGAQGDQRRLVNLAPRGGGIQPGQHRSRRGHVNRVEEEVRCAVGQASHALAPSRGWLRAGELQDIKPGEPSGGRAEIRVKMMHISSRHKGIRSQQAWQGVEPTHARHFWLPRPAFRGTDNQYLDRQPDAE